MSAKQKPNTRPAYANVDLGEERKARINRYCAQVELSTGKRPKQPDAINALLDIALDKEVPEPAEQTA